MGNGQVDWRDYIVSTSDVLRGEPRIKGTRIPVSLILGYLAAGYTIDPKAHTHPINIRYALVHNARVC